MTNRPLRADARRNRERILETAYTVFAAEGLTVPIDEVARRAGVGAGTVYRHFPTKEALLEAIVLTRVERLIAHAAHLLETAEADRAFFDFLTHMIDEGVANRALADGLAGIGVDAETAAGGAEHTLQDVFAALLHRAQRAGAVRRDVEAADVKALVVGCVAMRRQRPSKHLTAIVLDGLRPGAADTQLPRTPA
ncbi:TetR/AcrR family transcriptional regulator [Planobispora siamensis]|uniref:TetR family transcriptional regulator n=1 Tax=Planobispora siamensis TaxID=936338 RepID=A0A8J3SMB8_9ACTN|nr:TetR/AcrR family transcriptional regulator [Planobispora siamensis]GIH97088.1 TetR family transcriptional regulator [Planobispora siamensis]